MFFILNISVSFKRYRNVSLSLQNSLSFMLNWQYFVSKEHRIQTEKWRQRNALLCQYSCFQTHFYFFYILLKELDDHSPCTDWPVLSCRTNSGRGVQGRWRQEVTQQGDTPRTFEEQNVYWRQIIWFITDLIIQYLQKNPSTTDYITCREYFYFSPWLQGKFAFWQYIWHTCKNTTWHLYFTV